jgi:hypothetical protein
MKVIQGCSLCNQLPVSKFARLRQPDFMACFCLHWNVPGFSPSFSCRQSSAVWLNFCLSPCAILFAWASSIFLLVHGTLETAQVSIHSLSFGDETPFLCVKICWYNLEDSSCSSVCVLQSYMHSSAIQTQNGVHMCIHTHTHACKHTYNMHIHTYICANEPLFRSFYCLECKFNTGL